GSGTASTDYGAGADANVEQRFTKAEAPPTPARAQRAAATPGGTPLRLVPAVCVEHLFQRIETMNAVVQHNPDSLPAETGESATILSVISRAASDPNVDIDKMERLLQMHERMQDRQAEAQFAADLAEMQDQLPSIGERGNAAGRYTYALWEDITAAIKPILKRFGFA